MNILEIDDVHVTYRRRGQDNVHAVRGVSLSVAPGKILGLVGESGCGKSSLARVAVGLEAPTSGIVCFEGEPLRPSRVAARAKSALRLQMIFQNPYASLSPRRTIGDQLLDGLRGSVGKIEGKAESIRLLELVGLDPDCRHRYPSQFSGGQRQRIAIARSLAADPSVMIADEPVTALDAFSSDQIVKLLVGLVRDLQMGMLFISHDLSLVGAIADETAVMYEGKIVEQGPSKSLWSHPSHEYTKSLLTSIPVLVSNQQK